MTDIIVPVSPGELLDKISILEIKSERLDDPGKLDNVRHELDVLSTAWQDAGMEDEQVANLRDELKRLNEELWQIENEIRKEERRGEFGDRFVELARAVYATNDRRSLAKRSINLHLGSDLIEEKSYS